MQINSVQTPSALYGGAPAAQEAQPEKALNNQAGDKADKALTVTISPAAQALQKAAAAGKGEGALPDEGGRKAPQEAQQPQEAQRPAGKAASRIDLMV